MNWTKKLKKTFGEDRVFFRQEERVCYAYDATRKEYLPDAVVFVESAQDVINLMQIANEEKVPVIPRGAGSGFTGGSLAIKGGIVASTERMNRILEIDEKNLTSLVEPGVITGDLHKEVKKIGLFYPPDPSSLDFCTIGGNVAENAGGPKAVKYGVTKDYVLGIEAVLPTGKLITTGRKVIKDVVGYDLTRLFVGSEGTLAFFTKILLRLIPLPESTKTMLSCFKSRKSAAEAVAAILKARVLPSAIEFIDKGALEAVAKYKRIFLKQKAEAVLLIEVDGDEGSVSKLLEKIGDICEKIGGKNELAKDEIEADRLWEIRRAISPSLVHIAPTKINEDIVVPRSELPKALDKIEELEEKYKLPIICFGHAGDGNIHVNIMTDEKDPLKWDNAQKALKEIFQITVDLGGSISGEHGVGITKAPFIHLELSPEVIELQKKIKKIFDPENILNPGKMGV